MRISITARHFDLTDGLREHTEERLEKLDRYSVPFLDAHVVLTVEKYRHQAEVTLQGKGFSLNGKAESSDMYTSVDQAVQKLEAQVRRHKDKTSDRKQKGESKDHFARVGIVTSESVEMDGDDFEIIQSGEVTPPVMSVEDAIVQLKESEEDYMLITNPASDRVTVVLRRADGDYGVVEV